MTNPVRLHIKNNRWAAGSFPNTPEGEEVFTITRDRFDAELAKAPALKGLVDPVIDWDEDNFAKFMATADVLLTWNLPTENLRQVAPNLKWIHIIGAGVEHLAPLDWLPEGVTLTNNKGVHAAKAGEYGLMACLMLHNRMPAIITNQQNKHYESLYGTPIAGRTVVFVGTGSLGGAAARLVKKLGAHVVGINRSGHPVEGCDEVHTFERIDDVLPRADIVYLAVPDTPQTRGLIDRHRLSLLKETCGIANIGRQSVMDYDALCEALQANKLSGAILDVFDPEPVDPGSRLWHTPGLVMTPHVSADDGDSYIPGTLKLFFDNLILFLDGKPLQNVVDPVHGY